MFRPKKVWKILAHDYANIGHWASAIPSSAAVTGGAVMEGAPVCGRTCDPAVSGFSTVTERFTAYDEDAKMYRYEAVSGLPFMIAAASNKWTVEPLSETSCRVTTHAEAETKTLLGRLLTPLLKWQFGRVGNQTIEELKYYAENDAVHPRKKS